MSLVLAQPQMNRTNRKQRRRVRTSLQKPDPWMATPDMMPAIPFARVSSTGRAARRRRNRQRRRQEISPVPNSSNSGALSTRRDFFNRMVGPVMPRVLRVRSQLTGRGGVNNQTVNRQSMVIEEDEYIAEVTGATTAANFATTQYPVNIGQATTFPWGSGVVKNNFEKYVFEYLEFYYKREVSEFAVNGTTGKVMLHFDTDASDGPPTTKQMVEDTDPHVDGMPCENLALVIPSDLLQRMNDGWFVRPAGQPGGTDIKTYDVGNLYVSTQGLAGDSAVVGELHVRYRVRVFVPILEGAMTFPTNNKVSQFSQLSVNLGPSGVAIILPFATVDYNGLAAVNTGGVITLPVGNFLLDVTDSVTFSQQNQFDTTVLKIYHNGVQLNNQITTTNWPAVVTEAASYSQSLSAFVQMASGDTIKVTVVDTYAAGTVAHTSSLRIVSV